MRRIAVLAGAIVFGASVAASAAVITRDQWTQFFSSAGAYNQGFRAGYAAGIADAATAVYGNPALINPRVARCTQAAGLPTLEQLADTALQQWLGGNSPHVSAAAQVLGAYATCPPEPKFDNSDKNKN